MEKNWISAAELAQRWNLSTRRINQLCKEQLIDGAYKVGRSWVIPADIDRPSILREPEPEYTVNPRRTAPLPCPVGITSYREVSQKCYYIDKTLLIKDILDDYNQVYLFTRPRRFGKTLAMDMVRTFFEKTDEDTSHYFVNRNIWFEGPEYRSHQGQYPVIFLSFKDLKSLTWEELYRSLCLNLQAEYLRHVELLDSDVLTIYDKKDFENILNDTADSVAYQFSLERLSSMLSTHYGQKVIVIIDEYDTPIQQGHLHGYYEQIVSFMRNLFSSVLKDNPHLQFGILTGILRVAKESLFSGLNNLIVNTILDERYSEYFGFTGQEVSEMAAYYHAEDRLSEIQSWYDGYQFGNTEIYNPWSVINYFNNKCKPKAFWARSSGNEIINELFQSSTSVLRNSLTSLLQGETVEALIDTDIIYPEIGGDPDIIYSFLLVTGYLRIDEIISEFNDFPICSLRLPNREIRGIFQKEILHQYSPLLTGSILRDFALALREGNADQLQAVLQQYLLQSTSYFDTANESFYHGTLFGMLAIMSDHYSISSNREAGEGRFDIQLEPRDKTQQGYLIELKAASQASEEELQALSQSALCQILDKYYASDMKYHGIQSICAFGVACCGKRAAVSCQVLDV